MFTKEDKQEINELVSRLQNNDMEALDKLYTKMYKRIFCFLKNFCFDDEIIKDAIENAFITIMNKAKNKMFYTNCYAWILKVCKFTLFNLNRKYKKEDDYGEYDYEMQDNHSANSFDFIEVESLLRDLPELERRIVYLKVYQNMSYTEISKILKVSESTLFRRYKRVRAYLKRVYLRGGMKGDRWRTWWKNKKLLWVSNSWARYGSVSKNKKQVSGATCSK